MNVSTWTISSILTYIQPRMRKGFINSHTFSGKKPLKCYKVLDVNLNSFINTLETSETFMQSCSLITIYYRYEGNISRFPIDSEASASELIENIEVMFTSHGNL